MRSTIAATTAATVGTAAASRRSQAIVPVAAYGAAVLAGKIYAATGAAVVGYRLFNNGIDDAEVQEIQDDTVQQSTWEILTSINEGRSAFVEELRFEYGFHDDTLDILSTSHGDAMFSAVESSIARSRVDGESSSVATERARDDLSGFAATAVWNNLNRWNSYWSAVSSAMRYSINDEGVMRPESGSFTGLEAATTDIDPAESEPIVEIDGDTYLWADYLDGPNVDLPDWMTIDDVENQDGETVSSSDLFVIRYAVDGEVVDVLEGLNVGADILADHPDYGVQTLASPQFYADLVDTTRTLRNDLSSDMSSTVSAIYEQFDVGARDPFTIISSQELAMQFDDGGDELSEQAAVSGLAARGYALPDDLDARVTINHPDLEDETTGRLFVDAVGTVSAVSGSTIAASDYDMAYVVYRSAVDDTVQVETLSGDYGLELVDYTEEEIVEIAWTDENTDMTVRNLYLGDVEDDDLSLLEDPEPNIRVVITGEENTQIIEPSELQDSENNNYSYQIENDFGELKPVTVEIVNGLVFEDREDRFISDPTNPTETKDRVDQNQQTWDEINEKLEELANPGFSLDGSESSIALIIAAIAGIAVLFGGGR